MHRKLNLPEKICDYCQLPFKWRKKWQRDWPQVKYCSERCRRSAKTARSATDSGSNSNHAPQEQTHSFEAEKDSF